MTHRSFGLSRQENTRKSTRRKQFGPNGPWLLFAVMDLGLSLMHGRAIEWKRFGYQIDERNPRLEEAWNFESRNSGNTTGEVLNLAGELFINAPRRFVHCRANQVLQHFLIF